MHIPNTSEASGDAPWGCCCSCARSLWDGRSLRTQGKKRARSDGYFLEHFPHFPNHLSISKMSSAISKLIHDQLTTSVQFFSICINKKTHPSSINPPRTYFNSQRIVNLLPRSLMKYIYLFIYFYLLVDTENFTKYSHGLVLMLKSSIVKFSISNSGTGKWKFF